MSTVGYQKGHLCTMGSISISATRPLNKKRKPKLARLLDFGRDFGIAHSISSSPSGCVLASASDDSTMELRKAKKIWSVSQPKHFKGTRMSIPTSAYSGRIDPPSHLKTFLATSQPCLGWYLRTCAGSMYIAVDNHIESIVVFTVFTSTRQKLKI
jgi:hypothetical protein